MELSKLEGGEKGSGQGEITENLPTVYQEETKESVTRTNGFYVTTGSEEHSSRHSHLYKVVPLWTSPRPQPHRFVEFRTPLL